jgi:TorA maturation chaperone TorD
MTEYQPDRNQAHEDLCRFLSACFYEPCEEFAEEKLFDNMLIAAAGWKPELSDYATRLKAAFDQNSIESLLVDYTQLFLGPLNPHAKPYGASWTTQSNTSEDNPHLAVLDIYSAGGFDIDESFQELPDHIAVELEFLYLLIFNGNQALLAQNSQAQAEVEGLKSQFLREHLGAWIAPFATAVKENAKTGFYAVLADFTEQFVRWESELISLH